MVKIAIMIDMLIGIEHIENKSQKKKGNNWNV